MHETPRDLWLAHDGPAPPADLAAARWGAGALLRLARGAQAALAEARLRACLGALARLRRQRVSSIGRLGENAMGCRSEALAAAR